MAIGLIAAAIAVGVWLASSGSDSAERDWDGWTGYAPLEDLHANSFDARRREGLEKILSGMRAHGARPEQIANIESKLDRLDAVEAQAPAAAIHDALEAGRIQEDQDPRTYPPDLQRFVD